MNAPRKTGWYPVSISPIREGAYEYQQKDGHPFMVTWARGRWRIEWGWMFFTLPDDEWRGLDEDPKTIIAKRD